jgi:hypothetical protein
VLPKVPTCAKFAVIVPVPLIVAVVDADVGLVIVIDPVALHDENMYPVFAFAVIEVDASHQLVPIAGVVVPLPEGLTAKVTWY